MIRILRTQAFNRVAGLALLTLMVLALITSPSAKSRSQEVSPPAAIVQPAAPGSGDHEFRHEGE